MGSTKLPTSKITHYMVLSKLKELVVFVCKTDRIVTGLSPVDSNNWSYLVSQCFKPEHSVQVKNAILLYGNTRITCRRNTLLNDSYYRCFVSQTFFTVNTITFLCVFNFWYNTRNGRNHWNTTFWHILPAYFTTSTHSKKFKMVSWVFIPYPS